MTSLNYNYRLEANEENHVYDCLMHESFLGQCLPYHVEHESRTIWITFYMS